MIFYHFYSRRTPQLNKVAQKLKAEHQCEVLHLNIFDYIIYFQSLVFNKNFWIWGYNQKSYYYYYRTNILKTFIRYPNLYSYKFFKILLYIAFEFRTHTTKCLILFKLKNKTPGTIMLWNGSYFPHTVLIDFSKNNHFKTLYFEIGHFPNTMQVDSQGVNYFSSLSKDPQFYLNYKFKDSDILPSHIGVRKNKLKDVGQIVQKPSSYIFVVFQVPSDMQITVHSPWVKSMYHLYDILFEMVSKIDSINFVIKEHPSFKLKIFKKVKPHPRIIFDNWGHTESLIQNSEAVLTVNSTAGVESLALGKKVISLGLANYNIPNLVLNARNANELYSHLIKIKGWNYDNYLREQFLKYYYNKFLISGAYANLNETSLDQIKAKTLPNAVQQPITPSTQHLLELNYH